MKRDGVVRPLVVRFGAMGDMVIVLGLIEALHRRFGVPVTGGSGTNDGILGIAVKDVEDAWDRLQDCIARQ